MAMLRPIINSDNDSNIDTGQYPYVYSFVLGLIFFVGLSLARGWICGDGAGVG